MSEGGALARSPQQPRATDPGSEALAAYERGAAKLEGEVAAVRRNGTRALRQLHRLMARELQTAERRLERARRRGRNLKRRLDDAERRAARATERAEQAERELADLRGSLTWRTGSAVLAVPRRVRGLRRPGPG